MRTHSGKFFPLSGRTMMPSSAVFQRSRARRQLVPLQNSPSRVQRNFHFGKLFLQISPAFIDHSLGLAQMLIVFQRCQRADLSDAVHVKWLPCFVEHLDQISRPNGIADTQAGQSMNFRKRAQNNDVPSFANESQRIGRTIEELEICFIENDDYVFRAREMKSSIACCEIKVPVGLFGFGTK